MTSLNKNIILFVIFVLILGLFVPQKFFIIPIRAYVQVLESPITKSISRSVIHFRKNIKNIISLSDIVRQNEELQKENAELIAQNTNLEELKNENNILKRQLNFNNTNSDFTIIPAHITQKDSNDYLQIISIDVGKKDGVSSGQAVILNSFLIGKIDKVYSNYSTVSLVTNRESIVNAMVTSSRADGIVTGELGFGLIIESVPQDASINIGDDIITSGLGENMPKGLMLGKVSKIISDESEIFQRASINSPINFNNLETVFVITKFKK